MISSDEITDEYLTDFLSALSILKASGIGNLRKKALIKKHRILADRRFDFCVYFDYGAKNEENLFKKAYGYAYENVKNYFINIGDCDFGY